MPNQNQNPLNFASLPNSRIRPRKPTDQAFTFRILAQDPDDIGYSNDNFDTTANEPASSDRGKSTTEGNTILIEKNKNRTYITLRNLDSDNPIVYGYADNALMDLLNTPIEGVSLEDSGFVLRAGDSVDLETPLEIYVRSHAPAGEPVLVAVDYGIG